VMSISASPTDAPLPLDYTSSWSTPNGGWGGGTGCKRAIGRLENNILCYDNTHLTGINAY